MPKNTKDGGDCDGVSIMQKLYGVLVKVHGVDEPYEFVDEPGTSYANLGTTAYMQIGRDMRLTTSEGVVYIPYHAVEWIQWRIGEQGGCWTDDLCPSTEEA